MRKLSIVTMIALTALGFCSCSLFKSEAEGTSLLMALEGMKAESDSKSKFIVGLAEKSFEPGDKALEDIRAKVRESDKNFMKLYTPAYELVEKLMDIDYKEIVQQLKDLYNKWKQEQN